jgi:hypothetical protein
MTYAASPNEPTNPHGETDAVYRFEGYDPGTSTAIRRAIEQAVLSRGNALPGSLSDYLPGGY